MTELFSRYEFGPVIQLPKNYEVYDFTQGYDPNRVLTSDFGIGKYNEKRKNMYSDAIFNNEAQGLRDNHVGIDIGAPANTPVLACYDGEIFCSGINPASGDYGGTLITKHLLGQTPIWILHGHLSHASVQSHRSGQAIKKGQIIANVGTKSENGGWNPHLHFQVSLIEPKVCDMPGVVSDLDLAQALQIYPDPRLILGPLY